jgi:hypothetical protein
LVPYRSRKLPTDSADEAKIHDHKVIDYRDHSQVSGSDGREADTDGAAEDVLPFPRQGN